MRIILSLSIVFVIFLVSRTTCSGEEGNAIKSVEGVWKTEAISVGGKLAGEPPKAVILVTFTTSVMIMEDGGNSIQFKYSADATKDPCEMDQTITHEGETLTTKCIYQRRGDILTIASSMTPGGARPTAISFPPGQTPPDHSVMSLRLLSAEELTKLRQTGEDDAGKAAMAVLRGLGAHFDMNENRMVRTVMLSGTNVSDTDLKHLASFKELDSVSLAKTSVGNNGMKNLAAIDNLKRLNLSMTAVDDAGVQALAGMKHLEVLDLIGTGITDESVNILSNLKRLKEVDISLTKVTPAGKKRLGQALPDCEVKD